MGAVIAANPIFVFYKHRMDQLILLLFSFLANLFSAFSGGGAGLIQLPLLLFLGLPFGIALATHKVASVALGQTRFRDGDDPGWVEADIGLARVRV
jgi:hypothetical protein